MGHIRLSNVNLDYPLMGMGSRSFKQRIIGSVTGGVISAEKSVPIVKALDGISFTLTEGDRLGLIGHNGAGKSTLLKVLAGIYQPTRGAINLQGRIVSTLNISLGMDAEATGYENIIIRGLLLGMSHKEIDGKIEEIADFTELGQYLDLPVRIYSSGMLTRLAFATVTAMEPDILLMDEVIGTGDASFIHKAEKRLNEFMSRSKILVLASHSEEVIRKFCNKGLLLKGGKIESSGSVEEVIECYRNSIL